MTAIVYMYLFLFCLDCSYGFYGEDCVGVCGECKGNKTCEVDNGNCLYGCEPGYYEPNCTIRKSDICTFFLFRI